MDEAGRIGKAVEYAVAAAVVLGTQGKVNAATAMWDDEGVDLTFFTRDSSVDIQVKSRGIRSQTVSRGRYVAGVRQATFRVRDDLWMLFCLFDHVEATVGPFWLIRSDEFAQNAPLMNSGLLRFSASTKPDSRDRWSAYRVDRVSLPARILDILGATPIAGV